MLFAKVDADRSNDIFSFCEVSTVPSIHVYNNKNCIRKLSGFDNIKEFLKNPGFESPSEKDSP